MNTFNRGELLVKGRVNYYYRVGPVPGVRCSNRSYRGYRCPQTTQEKKQVYIADEDVFSLPAGQINKITKLRRYLPSHWDDIHRGDIRRHTSWKRGRSHQYRS